MKTSMADALWEMAYGLYDFDAYDASRDDDYDGWLNYQEYQMGTHPMIPSDQDSDQDGIPDGWEDSRGLISGDPNDAHSTDPQPYPMSVDRDQDGLTNLEEYRAGTDPNLADSDRDGVPDGQDLWPADPAYAMDDDFDGLPNAYETQNFPGMQMYVPLDPNLADDAQFDQDGDTNGSAGIPVRYQPFPSQYRWRYLCDHLDPWPTDGRYDLDDDNDRMPNLEMEYGLNPNDPTMLFNIMIWLAAKPWRIVLVPTRIKKIPITTVSTTITTHSQQAPVAQTKTLMHDALWEIIGLWFWRLRRCRRRQRRLVQLSRVSALILWSQTRRCRWWWVLDDYDAFMNIHVHPAKTSIEIRIPDTCDSKCQSRGLIEDLDDDNDGMSDPLNKNTVSTLLIQWCTLDVIKRCHQSWRVSNGPILMLLKSELNDEVTISQFRILAMKME